MSHPDQPPLTVYDMTDPEERRQSFEAECKTYRHQILGIGETLKELAQHPRLKDATDSEINANLLLAYRHLEDARMRLGKAIQASDGGASVYKD